MGKGGRKILITGGAGFIGQNLAKKLINSSYEITIFDNFSEQIHAGKQSLNDDLNNSVELIVGDVRDKQKFSAALKDANVVIHFAAETGTGQSMYNFERYSDVNVQATAVLCDYLVNEDHSIEQVIVASSRSIYGEGKYKSAKYGDVFPSMRSKCDDRIGYEVRCPESGEKNLMVQATDENSKIHPSSLYGITKQVQEQMLMLACNSISINCVSLRYQNVYGPGQSLNNPYTGILSIFTRLALSDEDILIFEDGKETRDFVYIDDVVAATISCLELKDKNQYAINVGSGNPISVLQVAQEIVSYLRSESKIRVTGIFREGDIRHNFADLKKSKEVLNFSPKYDFKIGLHRFIDWVLDQQDLPSSVDDYNKSLTEMRQRGMLSQTEK